MGKSEKCGRWFRCSKHFLSSLKKIYGIYKTKNFTKEQIRKYKMTKKEILEKYDKLSKNELNTKKHQRSLCQKWFYDYCY